MKILSFFMMLALPVLLFAQQDPLLNILEEELTREFESLQEEDDPPYFISYRVTEEQVSNIAATFGSLIKSEKNKDRTLTVEVRVGSPQLDNSHKIRDQYSFYFSSGSGPAQLPLLAGEKAIKQILWQETDISYRNAVKKLSKVKANIAVKVKEEDESPDFSKEKPSQYYESPPENIKIDVKAWEERLKECSAYFLKNKNIFEGTVSLEYKVVRHYFVSSEGSKIAHNLSYARIMMSGKIKADDGMILPLYKDYFAYKPQDLPEKEVIIADIKALVKKLEELREAPVVEPYAGPALLSGEASGVFFHEIFGHRVEGQRQKSESDGQTFKKKVGERVLPENMSVIFDPTIKFYEGFALNGHYLYDDQGIKAQKVTVVDHGILENFLMSRCPIEGFSNSNGHGRAYKGKQPVARQSNLIVETEEPKTINELKQMLIDEAKSQGLEYGYYFKAVTGGFTMTGRFIPNAFNVMPIEVYRVYVDGRPDELVRGVDLVGTPLAMFSKIEAAADDIGLFTGMCGAESGWVPVSALSPTLFVSQIELQKKSKSQEKPLLLPRPDQEDNEDDKEFN